MNTPLTDAELVRRIRTDDATVWNEVLLRMKDRVRRLVLRNGGTLPDVEDLLMTTSMAVRRAIFAGRYRHQDRFEGYFYRVARNLWLAELRRRNRWVEVAYDPQDAERFTEAEAPDPEELARADRLADLAAECLKNLGEPCRSMLRDAYLYKLPQRELAQRYSMTYGAFRAKLLRCRNRVLREIERHSGGE